jgi:hypothetical protein
MESLSEFARMFLAQKFLWQIDTREDQKSSSSYRAFICVLSRGRGFSDLWYEIFMPYLDDYVFKSFAVCITGIMTEACSSRSFALIHM